MTTTSYRDLEVWPGITALSLSTGLLIKNRTS